ncbi:hypothetical protein DPMN_048718 [Dreissena polymorpha]|uniref:Uncharacterized protein n=1 Tax=Dreissena polymorpha TaxID=45954 RepID=A0A9D4DAI1_DREPO|nr:hypothetical protein DPMN_048718 [Dreissena polymorpha]
MDGQTDGWTDNSKTISLRLRRDSRNPPDDVLRQIFLRKIPKPPRHFQDMAPDGRKDGRTDDGQRPVTKADLSNQCGGFLGWDDWTTGGMFKCFHYIHIEKTAPPPGGHAFSLIWTIFELLREINETNVLTKFHDVWAKIVTSRVFTRNTAPPPGGHVFQWTETIFELNQHIIKTNILTKLHEDWASNVTSTVFTSFKLNRGIIGTNVLTKFHEDRTINVASRVFTRQMLTTHARRTTDKRRSQ